MIKSDEILNRKINELEIIDAVTKLKNVKAPWFNDIFHHVTGLARLRI